MLWMMTYDWLTDWLTFYLLTLLQADKMAYSALRKIARRIVNSWLPTVWWWVPLGIDLWWCKYGKNVSWKAEVRANRIMLQVQAWVSMACKGLGVTVVWCKISRGNSNQDMLTIDERCWRTGDELVSSDVTRTYGGPGQAQAEESEIWCCRNTSNRWQAHLGGIRGTQTGSRCSVWWSGW